MHKALANRDSHEFRHDNKSSQNDPYLFSLFSAEPA